MADYQAQLAESTDRITDILRKRSGLADVGRSALQAWGSSGTKSFGEIYNAYEQQHLGNELNLQQMLQTNAQLAPGDDRAAQAESFMGIVEQVVGQYDDAPGAARRLLAYMDAEDIDYSTMDPRQWPAAVADAATRAGITTASGPAGPVYRGDPGAPGSGTGPYGGLTIDEVLGRISQAESGGDPTIANQSGSGAMGLYQFMPGTWNDIADRSNGTIPRIQYGEGGEIIDDPRTNPEFANAAAQLHLTQDIAPAWSRAQGRFPTAQETYASWWFGVGGGVELAQALEENPDMPLPEALARFSSPDQVERIFQQNPNLRPDMTVSDVWGVIDRAVGRGGGAPSGQRGGEPAVVQGTVDQFIDPDRPLATNNSGSPLIEDMGDGRWRVQYADGEMEITPQIVTPQVAWEKATEIQGQVRPEREMFEDARIAYENLVELTNVSEDDPNRAQRALATITAFQKLIDPSGRGVTDAEQRNITANAQGLFDEIEATLRRIAENEPVLIADVERLRGFAEVAKDMYGSAARRYQRTVDRTQPLLEAYALNDEQIDYALGTIPSADPAVQPFLSPRTPELAPGLQPPAGAAERAAEVEGTGIARWEPAQISELPPEDLSGIRPAEFYGLGVTDDHIRALMGRIDELDPVAQETLRGLAAQRGIDG